MDRMIEEFEYWYGKGFREFYFSDSLFVLNKKRVIDFCTYIIESCYNDVVFVADGVRADHLTFEVLQYMKNAHFKSLTLGLESINDKTLKFFNKAETFTQMDEAISMADSLGFDITIYLIIGAPSEIYEDAIKSIEYPLRYKNIVNSIVSKLTPIKGTEYYNYAIEHKLVSDTSICYPKHEVYSFNERVDSNDLVDQIWLAVNPKINEIQKFLSIRKQINKALNVLGLCHVEVKRLNMLTNIYLNPFMLMLIITPLRNSKSLIKYLLGPLKSEI